MSQFSLWFPSTCEMTGTPLQVPSTPSAASHSMTQSSAAPQTSRCAHLASPAIAPDTLPLMLPQSRYRKCLGAVTLGCISADYTYFYKGRDYWKFDNQKLSVEPGYPRNILRDWMGCNQKEVERRKERRLPQDDVDIMVTINDVPGSVNAVAVVIPCILSLCILVLVYTIFQFKNKTGPQPVTYYKRPVQEWV
ncbi:hypothetical protein P7K49_009631 [Saguinus oedipus]|uniref:Peptidase M10A matrix metallopeptidase C-terminal domain-containing protein n=1 Tax=Saguinus oedipus TaxID=9490 RepID=A0ABQ9VL43_SAGOE|nr:hypothetical protein P7K49_009631 [Saguinus oedipus]